MKVHFHALEVSVIDIMFNLPHGADQNGLSTTDINH